MGLFGSFLSRFAKNKATPEDLGEFRKALIEADIGAEFAEEIIKLVERERVEELNSRIADHLKAALVDSDRKIRFAPDRLTTILIVGVNGTGKTTSVAKLANKYQQEGRRTLLAAADTFRAAAVDQLLTWGERIGVPVVTGTANSDPAAIAFEAADRAKRENYDLLLIDTAGRLHTKSNLMEELVKVRRVVEKITPIDEVLFVLDGTTGQNGITQGRAFQDSVALSGLIVTKLDGSTKGGIALATERALNTPIKFVGTGEGVADIAEFEADTYIAGLLS